MYYLNKEEPWLFDSDDYYTLKNNFKKINTMFKKESYITYIKTIVADLERKLYSVKDLVGINSDGVSVLYLLYTENNYPISALVNLVDSFDLVDTSSESDEHQIFRKSLYLIKSIK